MQTIAHTRSVRINLSRDGDSISVAIRDNQVALPVRQVLLENLGRDKIESSRAVESDVTGRLLKSQADIRRSGSFGDDFIDAPIRNDQLSAEVKEVWLERTTSERKQD